MLDVIQVLEVFSVPNKILYFSTDALIEDIAGMLESTSLSNFLSRLRFDLCSAV